MKQRTTRRWTVQGIVLVLFAFVLIDGQSSAQAPESMPAGRRKPRAVLHLGRPTRIPRAQAPRSKPVAKKKAPAASQPQTKPAGAKTAESKPAESKPVESKEAGPYDALLKEYQEGETAREHEAIADPFRWWNMTWFFVNDRLYFWVLKPVSKGYGVILPRPVRVGIKNVFDNLAFPRRFVNSLFQARFVNASSELGRFLINSTVGLVGLWNPAKSLFHMEIHDADFDQSLGRWKIGMGIFLTWPFIGPSSIRGTFGYAGDLALNPATLLPGASAVVQMNNISLGLDEYESILQMAVRPYVAVRDAYVDYRRKKISDPSQ